MAAAGALQLRRLAAAAAAVSSSASHHHASSARAVAGAAAGAALTSARAAGVAGRRPGAWPVATTSVAHYRVLFMGTDDISLVTLRALHDAMVAPRPGGPTVQSLAVLCPSDRPAGRGKHNTQMPVKAFAAAAGLPTAEVPYGIKSLKAWTPAWPGVVPPFDVGVVVSFGYFIPPHLLAMCSAGAINMHPSMLPKYRGAAPIPAAILGGETRTGVSIIDIHPDKFDAGKILLQEGVDIGADETCSQLTPRLAEIGARSILTVLADLEGRRARGTVQPLDTVAPRAPKLHHAAGDVAFGADLTVEALLRLYRGLEDSVGLHAGFTPAPGAPVKRLRLVTLARVTDGDDAPLLAQAATTPGALAYVKRSKTLYLRAADGFVRLAAVQPEYKRVQTGHEFAVGHHLALTGHTLTPPPAAPA